jgi:hypothetical protein
MGLGFLHCFKYLSFNPRDLDHRSGPAVPVDSSKRLALGHQYRDRAAVDLKAFVLDHGLCQQPTYSFESSHLSAA